MGGLMVVNNHDDVQFPLTNSDDPPSTLRETNRRIYTWKDAIFEGKVFTPFFSGANCSFEGVYVMSIIPLQGTNISDKNGILKMIFLSPRWDMLISWTVCLCRS